MDLGAWLSDESIFTTSVMSILIDRFGPEVLEWDPITVNLEITREFGVEPEEFLLDRAHAGAALLTSNLFHLSLESFSAICNTLNFGVVASETLIPASLDDILWGVTEARLIEGRMFDETPFSHNIARYVGVVLSNEGVTEPPSMLKFAELPEREQENRDANLLTDDPSMFSANWKNREEAKTNMDSGVRRRLRMLVSQLQELPLKNKDEKPLTQLQASLASVN
jgi:hypothetical protein